jgi:hypothetical protein
MKKIILVLSAVLAFSFNIDHPYSCETIGIAFKKDGKTYQIPNNKKTQETLKKNLKSLYSVSITPVKSNKLKVATKEASDTLSLVRVLSKEVGLFATKKRDLLVMVDNNASQIGINIPSQKMIIYYQCK